MHTTAKFRGRVFHKKAALLSLSPSSFSLCTNLYIGFKIHKVKIGLQRFQLISSAVVHILVQRRMFLIWVYAQN